MAQKSESSDEPLWVGDPMVRLEKAFFPLITSALSFANSGENIRDQSAIISEELIDRAITEISLVEDLLKGCFDVEIPPEGKADLGQFIEYLLSLKTENRAAPLDGKSQRLGGYGELGARIDSCLDVFRMNFIDLVIRRQMSSDINAKNARDELRSISKQIFYVSINASIEATRAGESGAAFEVICQEIRRLARQAEISLEQF